jgi:hypothetical protein
MYIYKPHFQQKHIYWKAMVEGTTESGKITLCSSRNRNGDCFVKTAAIFSATNNIYFKESISSGDAWYAVTATVMIFHSLKSYCGKGHNIFLIWDLLPLLLTN